MQCTSKKENGEPCKAHAMKGSEFCFLHNPKVPEEEKREMQSKGGSVGKITVETPLPPLPIATPRDVMNLLADTINRTRSNEVPPQIANTVGYLSGVFLKAFETSELKDKIDALERILLPPKK
jgi:hypothetical protein